MNLTMRQKSALVQAAERGLTNKPNRADTIVAIVGVIGCVVFVILAYLGAL